MSVFKRRRFPAEIILLCVRWYCRYGISYRDLEEMMAERGVGVDHVTLYCWVQRYAPELTRPVPLQNPIASREGLTSIWPAQNEAQFSMH